MKDGVKDVNLPLFRWSRRLHSDLSSYEAAPNYAEPVVIDTKFKQ